MEAIVVAALLLAFAVCVCAILTRPPLIEYDEDDMRDYIRSNLKKKAGVRKLEAKEAGGPIYGTYYDVFKRVAESKENQN